MQSQYEIHQNYYLINRSKLIYIENTVGGEALQHLKPCLLDNSITFFATILSLFNHLEDIFVHYHRNKHAMKKFQDLKIDICLFNDIYSELIRLTSNIKYLSE